MDIEPTIPLNVTFSDGVIREERTGKLTLIGTFHHFNPPKLPFSFLPFFVTVSLSNFRGKLDKFKVGIRLQEKSSGSVIFNSTGEINSTSVMSPSDTVQIPFQVSGGIFPQAGLYTVIVLADGEEIGSRDLVVNEPKLTP